MAKCLTSFGPYGKFSSHWNWCDPGELVGTHGKICEQEEYRISVCGCGISFFGLESSKATTQALVCNIAQVKYDRVLERFLLKKEQEGQDEYVYCHTHMEWLATQLWQFPIGQIVLVERIPVLRLIPDGVSSIHIDEEVD